MDNDIERLKAAYADEPISRFRVDRTGEVRIDNDIERTPIHVVLGSRSPSADAMASSLQREGLPSLLNQKSFWTNYLSVDDQRDATFGPYLIQLRVSGRCGLILEGLILKNEGSNDDLLLSHAQLPKPVKIGFCESSHPYPYVFRWEELETLCKGIARISGKSDSALALLLLSPFCWPDPEQRPQALTALHQALHSFGFLNHEECERLIMEHFQKVVFADEPIPSIKFKVDRRWREDPLRGWVMEGKHAYSWRSVNHQEFPFALFDELVRDARTALSEESPDT
jgi:hypothetical protein